MVIFYKTYLAMAIGAKLSKESKGSGVRVGKPVQTVQRQAEGEDRRSYRTWEVGYRQMVSLKCR